MKEYSLVFAVGMIVGMGLANVIFFTVGLI